MCCIQGNHAHTNRLFIYNKPLEMEMEKNPFSIMTKRLRNKTTFKKKKKKKKTQDLNEEKSQILILLMI